MASTEELLQLITQKTEEDPQIRGTVLSGSRANPRIPADCFQDFDVIFVVKEMDGFFTGKQESGLFQDASYYSMEQNQDVGDQCMQLRILRKDGKRLNLSFWAEETAREREKWDGIVLVDKDQWISSRMASEPSRYPDHPEERDYRIKCEHFFWGSIEVAKGLWRNVIPVVKERMECQVRKSLMEMIGWSVSVQTEFQIGIADSTAFLKEHLGCRAWMQLMKTYPDADRERIWDALFLMCQIFRDHASVVAHRFAYQSFDEPFDILVEYLRHVHTLPSNAKEIYPEQEKKQMNPTRQMEQELSIEETELEWNDTHVHVL